MKRHPLDPFLNPGSVAVVGASRRTGKGSFNLVERMIEFGFEGRACVGYEDCSEYHFSLTTPILRHPRFIDTGRSLFFNVAVPPFQGLTGGACTFFLTFTPAV